MDRPEAVEVPRPNGTGNLARSLVPQAWQSTVRPAIHPSIRGQDRVLRWKCTHHMYLHGILRRAWMTHCPEIRLAPPLGR